MDKSNIYIKMCDKFSKLNKNINWEEGDYIYCPSLNKTIIYSFVYTNVAEMGNFVVKLFRQDQLQNMYLKYLYQETYGEVSYFNASVVYACLRKILAFEEQENHQTMEQLWLAFVVKEKYNKFWNREDWK